MREGQHFGLAATLPCCTVQPVLPGAVPVLEPWLGGG